MIFPFKKLQVIDFMFIRMLPASEVFPFSSGIFSFRDSCPDEGLAGQEKPAGHEAQRASVCEDAGAIR